MQFSLIVMPPMLSGLGMPSMAVAHFIGIEPILDMFGTAQSVVGNITSAFIITRLENKVDDKIMRSDYSSVIGIKNFQAHYA